MFWKITIFTLSFDSSCLSCFNSLVLLPFIFYYYQLSIRGATSSSASSSFFSSFFTSLSSTSTPSNLSLSTPDSYNAIKSGPFLLPKNIKTPEEEEDWQRNKKYASARLIFYCHLFCWGIPTIELIIQLIDPPKCSNLSKPNMNLFHVMSKFYILVLFITFGISVFYFYLNILKSKQAMKLLDIGTNRGSIDKMSIRPYLVYLVLFLIANILQFPSFLFCFLPNFSWSWMIHLVQMLIPVQGLIFYVWFIYNFKLLQSWEKKNMETG